MVRNAEHTSVRTSVRNAVRTPRRTEQVRGSRARARARARANPLSHRGPVSAPRPCSTSDSAEDAGKELMTRRIPNPHAEQVRELLHTDTRAPDGEMEETNR